MSTVLIVTAHPDDEVLGCGGTIAKHSANGDEVHLLFLADGVGARGGAVDSAAGDRLAAMQAAAAILGIASTTCLDFPDNRLDSVTLLDVVQQVETVIDRLQPESVYTHHYGDLNVDHRITAQAVMTACRPLPGSSVKELLAFEVLSSTEWSIPGHNPFLPQLFVDISAYLEVKMKALEAYALEMRVAPHSRSLANVRSQALHRGHNMGLPAAEAFMLLRAIR